MRIAATLTLFSVVAVAGCRSQSTPISNPFLVPDRVTPPATQVLAPGAAQPYYPGDPMPAAAPAMAPPAGTFAPAPGAAPPASAYPGATYPGAAPGTTYPVSPMPPATAPLGGAYSPQAQGDAVGIPTDDQSMRFAAATLAPVESSTASAAMNATSASVAPPAQFRTPIQSILPVAGSPSAERAFTPNAGMQSPSSFPANTGVTPAAFETPVVTSATLSASSPDGFRPQGSQATSNSLSGFRPPAIGNQAKGGDNPTARFGVGPQQEWLRGQLEYWPETGQWSINYMAEGPKDQIGGRVLIDNPQVLANLSPGEFVAVEGQLFGRQIDEASYQPVYRVSSVQRQRQ